MNHIELYSPDASFLNSLTIHVPKERIEEFKEVIKRGTAFGTQTSPEMKVFADTLLGRISYTSQGTQLESKESSYQLQTVQVVEN